MLKNPIQAWSNIKLIQNSEEAAPRARMAARWGMICSALVLLQACNFSERESFSWPTDAELEQYNATVDPEDRIICAEETPVGTRIPQRTCRRAGNIEDTADLTQREFNRIIR